MENPNYILLIAWSPWKFQNNLFDYLLFVVVCLLCHKKQQQVNTHDFKSTINYFSTNQKSIHHQHYLSTCCIVMNNWSIQTEKCQTLPLKYFIKLFLNWYLPTKLCVQFFLQDRNKPAVYQTLLSTLLNMFEVLTLVSFYNFIKTQIK